MYSKAGEWQMALSVFTDNLSWQQALVTAARLKYTTDKQAELARSLAGKMARGHGVSPSERDYFELNSIQFLYLNSLYGMVTVYWNMIQ